LHIHLQRGTDEFAVSTDRFKVMAAQ